MKKLTLSLLLAFFCVHTPLSALIYLIPWLQWEKKAIESVTSMFEAVVPEEERSKWTQSGEPYVEDINTTAIGVWRPKKETGPVYSELIGCSMTRKAYNFGTSRLSTNRRQFTSISEYIDREQGRWKSAEKPVRWNIVKYSDREALIEQDNDNLKENRIEHAVLSGEWLFVITYIYQKSEDPNEQARILQRRSLWTDRLSDVTFNQ